MPSLSDRLAAVEAHQPSRSRYDLSGLRRDILEMIASLPDDGDMSGLSAADQACIMEALNGIA
ncbi:hypothetical protein [Sphingobium sp.]|uniref:hypothetical protein n=1 Tax=Sphingobium sp. TaxID=1912891 RepID=UPI002B89326D|nr:hypothetical protein [Sphingobium sp.]HUD91474.1 hypothetical protein [Sphingobium sp.]